MKRLLLHTASRRPLTLPVLSVPSCVLEQKISTVVTGCRSVGGRKSSLHSSSQLLGRRSPQQIDKINTSSSVEDAAAAEALRESMIRAPFQRAAGSKTLFPWRSTNEIMGRLIPGSEEFRRNGYLLGGNVISSNPTFDAYATAYLFMGVPLSEMMFFSQWQDDTAENMAWAFSQAMSGILSNAYGQSFETISKERKLGFDSAANPTDTDTATDAEAPSAGLSNDFLEPMVEKKLLSLFHDAQEYGKDQLQVRLEFKPKNAHMVNLFVFPFLSRNLLKIQPEIKDMYTQLLEFMGTNPRDAMPIYNEFVADFGDRGWTENTVIAQVLVPCEEVFWVKDLATGAIIQGVQDSTPRTVNHLVRMEMVVRSRPTEGFFPFEHEQGNWQMTDIDDLLKGNLLI
ncbi:unnamed protein product [Cylindrotheca closterium]|uniref:Uncharacterized protein n=1 Tax=Cylindrotheca closterium TaxID=2856 RepID=A0AAD2CDK1_9STRA|nr:unnamed protein product [Cylindrotheca closterium]